MCFFGVGNHGGGPTKAQIENIQSLARYLGRAQDPFQLSGGLLPGDLSSAHTGCPWCGMSCRFHAVGCYSANSLLKRSHRQAECGLLVAERMAVLDSLFTGRPFPAQKMNGLWHELAFNQFHDIICGSSDQSRFR